MELRKEISLLAGHLPKRKLLIVSILLAWALLSTVIPVPAPKGAGDPAPPC